MENERQAGYVPMRPENQNPLETREVSVFSPEARELLERVGYEIYTLTGNSIKDHTSGGRRFYTSLDRRITFKNWPRQFPDFNKFYNLPSLRSEVAIDPNRLFLELPEHKNDRNAEVFLMCTKPEWEDEDDKNERNEWLKDRESPHAVMIDAEDIFKEFSEKLSKNNVAGIKAIIGEAPDYIELMCQHLDRTGYPLFRTSYIDGLIDKSMRDREPRPTHTEIMVLRSIMMRRNTDWASYLTEDALNRDPDIVRKPVSIVTNTLMRRFVNYPNDPERLGYKGERVVLNTISKKKPMRITISVQEGNKGILSSLTPVRDIRLGVRGSLLWGNTTYWEDQCIAPLVVPTNK